MIYQIANNIITVRIDSLGAQLLSVKANTSEREYIWQAEPAYWAKSAPVLFPTIGKLSEGKYLLNGKEYEMVKHGFCQRKEFTLVLNTSDRVVFELRDDDETYQVYPFHFILRIEFMVDENKLIQTFTVRNLDEKEMSFALGGHPAFACENRVGKRIKLYGFNKSSCFHLDKDGLISKDDKDRINLPIDGDVITITENLFDQDALCFEDDGITAMALLDEKNQEYLKIKADAPVWGIWTNPDNRAGYICLEPWYGQNDYVEAESDINKKAFYNHLESGGEWNKKIQMIYN